MIDKADIVIIGGGVHGASLAFHLAKRKVGRIVLLERNWLASGPTARSGAMIRPLFMEDVYIRLVLASTKMFEGWKEEVGGDAGFVQNGFLRITESLDEAELGADLTRLKRLGVEYEILSADQLRRLLPTAEFTGKETGVFLPKGGFADPHKTTVSLARAAKRHGAEICEGSSVTSIEMERGVVRAVRTASGRIATNVVVNCAGAWSQRIAAMVNISLPIKVCRVPSHFFRRPERMAVSGPVLSDGVHRVYMRLMANNLFRAAPFSSPREIVDPDRFDEAVNQEQIVATQAALNKRYRSMRRTVSFGGFSALYDVTSDGHPIVSSFPQVEGFWCDCGWSGNGFAPAPAAGRSLAQLIIEGKSAIDLSMFGWPRGPGVCDREESKWNFVAR